MYANRCIRCYDVYIWIYVWLYEVLGMNDKLIFTISCILILAGVVVSHVYFTRVINRNENETLSINDVFEIKQGLRDCVAKEMSCVCPEYEPCEECEVVVCNVSEEKYLSLDEYTTMSVRIKWLENRLVEANSTDYIRSLEDNLTAYVSAFDSCNATLYELKEVIE